MLILKLNVASSGAWGSTRSKKAQKRITHEVNKMETVTSLTTFFVGASGHRMQYPSCSMVLNIRSKIGRTREKAYTE
jgi:hypothetical protein